MDPATPDDVFRLMFGFSESAAMGAALEHGLFWIVDEEPLSASDVADRLGIPEDRCRAWLEMLDQLGYLDHSSGTYAPSPDARTAILDAYARDTWAFLAGEARWQFPAVRDLAVQLPDPGTPWDAQGIAAPDWLGLLRGDPEWARRFTRMLYEHHLPLADQIANSLSMDQVYRILDVGGGSGVVSFALLGRNPDAEAVVLDLDHVCTAGREIAAENSMEHRVEYRTGDFIAEDLPAGFDLVVYCDAGPVDEALLDKFRAALNPGGRVAVVKWRYSSHPARAHMALVAALGNTPMRPQSVGDACALLEVSGFGGVSVVELPDPETRWVGGWTLIEAGI